MSPSSDTLKKVHCQTELSPLQAPLLKMGLPQVPSIAEKIGLERDLALISETKGQYHADQVTTGPAIETLRKYKALGFKRYSAGTSIHHVSLNDLDIGPYRSFLR